LGVPNSGYRAAVLQVDQPTAARGRPHPPSDWTSEQVERVRERGEPVFGDLLGLQHDARQGLAADLAAVEEESDTSRPVRARTAEVHARQPSAA
jgi:hypothetical protein